METIGFEHIASLIPPELKERQFNAIGSDLRSAGRLPGITSFTPGTSSPYSRGVKDNTLYQVSEGLAIGVNLQRQKGVKIQRKIPHIVPSDLRRSPDISRPNASMVEISQGEITTDDISRYLQILLRLCLYLSMYEKKVSSTDRSARILAHLFEHPKNPAIVSYNPSEELTIDKFATLADDWMTVAKRIKLMRNQIQASY